MSDQFRVVSPEASELQPILNGLFGEYAARYGDYFSRDAEVELTEWYLAPQGLFVVLERSGEIIATVQELERRALLAGYSRIYLTTGFRQPEAVRLYLSQGYDPQFDTARDPEEYSLPPFDGRLRFTKLLTIAGQARIA